jgi:alkylation response protein AidB-like acyl-CoA dehydrogenase
MIGAAQKSLEMASDYAKERTAFGQSIGAYQGLAHPLANSICDIDAARLMLWRTVSAVSNREQQAGSMVSQLWWFGATACQKAAQQAMRTLGGYGLTMEYDLQLFLRRIETWILINGDPAIELANAGKRLWLGEVSHLPDTGVVDIDFSLGEEAEQYACELKQFFDVQLTPELKKKAHHSTSCHDAGIHKQMAASGLVFGDWPKEAGGRGRSRYDVYASKLVFERYNWSFFMVATSSMVAAVLKLFGSDHAKAELLPRILAGELICSLGFSEPNSGSDVFAGKMTAVRCESTDDWLISGQKMFTTGAHIADYVLLLTRTDQQAKKHRGITLFLVPLNAQGVEVHKVDTLMSERTNISYYQDVRVPDSMRIGSVDGGAAVLGRALEIEQGGGDFQVSQVRMLELAVEWALAGEEGSRPVDNPDICMRLAEMTAKSNAAEVLVRRNLWASQECVPNKAWGPMSKLFATETYMDNAWALSQLVGPQALLKSKNLLGQIEQHHRRAYGTTIYAGTSEIHRSMIAEQVLGLPRTRG